VHKQTQLVTYLIIFYMLCRPTIFKMLQHIKIRNYFNTSKSITRVVRHNDLPSKSYMCLRR